MIKLQKGFCLDGDTIRISKEVASDYIPYVVLDCMPHYDDYYYCKEEIPIYFCPMLASKLIDSLFVDDNCISKLEQLQSCLDHAWIFMTQNYPHFMFNDTNFKGFRKRRSPLIFNKINEYFK